jgi:hypothetical protein
MRSQKSSRLKLAVGWFLVWLLAALSLTASGLIPGPWIWFPIPRGLKVTTTTLPAITGGAVYSAALTASGGKVPYTWLLASGSLPRGLALSGSMIKGTPPYSCPASFTVEVKDNKGNVAMAPLSIASATVLTIPAQTLPDTVAGQPYSYPLVTAGGCPPLTFAVVNGQFPDGLSLTSDGRIAGTPTVDASVTMTATGVLSLKPRHHKRGR